MANVKAILLDAMSAQLDTEGNILLYVNLERLNNQVRELKVKQNGEGFIRAVSEVRRVPYKNLTHMPPICVQWGLDAPDTSTDNSYGHLGQLTTSSSLNGHTVKQSAADEEL